MNHLDLGKAGEQAVSLFLTRKGYAIMERNFRTRWGEIDLIARDKEDLVFVEVKTRRGAAFGTGAEAVIWHKQQKIIKTAQIYLSQKRLDAANLRFDVVEVNVKNNSLEFNHIVNAFGD
ncbi:YraN family protein [Acetonema longum]|uniref:UPF0102 protein ALO_13977 n=1 Tax=Acetonema longum DSM 6540 TaxID=1009370 RepID=F7NL23_9FIRM|nr:YraN family protein [Acetonema longum]EGO63128.1 hypothetical protein ALO_13977 [Acetonema longum DSM 6540]